MDERWMYGGRPPSVLADLGPLPEVVESDSETSWKAFLEAQAVHNRFFPTTEPAGLGAGPAVLPSSTLDVQEVMAEARRQNRICPRDASWHALCSLLQDRTGAEPPPPISGEQASRTPPLVKRIRIRDQVEWAAQHGQLPAVLQFFQSLPEERWQHMRD